MVFASDSDSEMRASQVPNQTPDGEFPDRNLADYVWTALAPRLIHPAARAIIQALLQADRPLSPIELVDQAQIQLELVRYQCKAMSNVGVLEVVREVSRVEGGRELAYYFPKPLPNG